MVFPANAGMIPGTASVCCCALSVPRECGDDPVRVFESFQPVIVFPANAGMILMDIRDFTAV